MMKSQKEIYDIKKIITKNLNLILIKYFFYFLILEFAKY